MYIYTYFFLSVKIIDTSKKIRSETISMWSFFFLDARVPANYVCSRCGHRVTVSFSLQLVAGPNVQRDVIRASVQTHRNTIWQEAVF